MLARLTADVKNCLDITWDDPETDKKVSGWTRAGINYLDSRAGEQMDYQTGSDEWTLLMDYARYARDGALDVFEGNYLHLILSMQNERRMGINPPAAAAALPPLTRGAEGVDL
mgnify:CR=1 FL=1